MLRKRRCAPPVKTRCSRFSVPYAFTTRIPPSVSFSRPVTCAVISPRSRKIGRSFENVTAIAAPKPARMRMMISVSFQLR